MSLQIERMPIGDVRVDERNARKHSSRNLDAIRRSLDVFGQQKPIVVDAKGIIVAGNGTLEAARGLGWTHIDAVRSDLAGPQRTAYAIADNRTAELAEWEETELVAHLEELTAVDDFEETVTGFDEREIGRMLQGEIVEDEVPQIPETPITRPGDLWLLGEHRLLCGDATKADDVLGLLAQRKATMCFTDPPWNVGIGQDSNPRHRQREGLANDNLSEADFTCFLKAFAHHLGMVVGDVYCVLGASQWPALDHALRATGLHWSATIVWIKQTFVLGRSKYHRRYEPIWYGWRNASSYCGDRSEDDVWNIDRPFRSEVHPTMKPVALVARAIANSSHKKDIIYDPFLGSGTTLIAAEQLGRRCYGIEIEPKYVDVACRRWANLTGKSPVRESDGAKFGDL